MLLKLIFVEFCLVLSGETLTSGKDELFTPVISKDYKLDYKLKEFDALIYLPPILMIWCWSSENFFWFNELIIDWGEVTICYCFWFSRAVRDYPWTKAPKLWLARWAWGLNTMFMPPLDYLYKFFNGIFAPSVKFALPLSYWIIPRP